MYDKWIVATYNDKNFLEFNIPCKFQKKRCANFSSDTWISALNILHKNLKSKTKSERPEEIRKKHLS